MCIAAFYLIVYLYCICIFWRIVFVSVLYRILRLLVHIPGVRVFDPEVTSGGMRDVSIGYFRG